MNECVLLLLSCYRIIKARRNNEFGWGIDLSFKIIKALNILMDIWNVREKLR